MKIQVKSNFGTLFKREVQLREYVSDSLEENLHDSGIVEDLVCEVRNLRRAVGVLTEILVEKNLMSLSQVQKEFGSFTDVLEKAEETE